MHKLRTGQESHEDERRNGEDRRQRDGEPPGRHERRRGVESRQPEVIELDMSTSEWAALNQDFFPRTI